MDKFEKATGRTIPEWMDFLRNHENGNKDLNELSHKQMATLAEDYGASGWWAQSIAVDIEREIGRREVGQRDSGKFSANATKTMPGEWTDVFARFTEFMASAEGALPAAVDGESSTSESEKWRYWRADLVDGTKVVVMCNDASAKGVAKTRFAVQHEKLPSSEARDDMKAHWKATLDTFKASLG
ncbi:hypothetical protein [Corynebacterium lubricantis]|uniref:hypothetical protein n=1 Tax=Corynebacterium lubricantis TaxID=541095 RepID=UPI00036B7054|nr:hypothetical protein [Corynebacterium lubricantis]